MSRRIIWLALLLGAFRLANAQSVVVHAEILLSKAKPMEKSTEVASKCELIAYVENVSSETITIPTKGYDSVIAHPKHNTVKLLLFFPPDEVYERKRVVRPLGQLSPVSIKPGEIARIEYKFFWPAEEKGEYDFVLTLEIKKAAASLYGFWFGSSKSACKGILDGQNWYDSQK
jgi:hypothetical protein